MKRQPTWDKFEVVLLIDSYIQIKEQKKNKNEVLKKLSCKLRKKAQKSGMNIDDTFRNLNGMQWQIKFIDCAFNNKNFGNHSPSKMFRKMVDMYQNDKEQFDSILAQAEEIIDGTNEFEDKCCDIENNKLSENDEKLLNLVGEHFVYGFRINSVIDMMKLKSYAEDTNLEIYEDENKIREIIKDNGILMNEKVYIKSKSTQDELRNLIEEICEKGVAVIYYKSLLENHIELLENLHITSEQVLKETLMKVKSDFTFSKNYFSNKIKTTEEMAVTKEILRVWDNDITISIEELSGRLLYVPIDKIRFYLAANGKFVWVTEGVYTNIEKLIMKECEVEEISIFVDNEIKRRGFSSLSEIPLGDALEENYELPELAIRFLIFNKFLSDEYYLKGKIITKDNAKIDAVTIMKQICLEKEEYTLDEAIEDVGSLIGSGDRRIAYPALYDVMVRVDEQKFVSDKKVHFDVDVIDNVLDSFVNDGFTAIKEITTFALFPICGQTWNHYLLESYCHRYSRNYRYRTNLYNSRNAGAIVKSDNKWDYYEILAQAVARAKVELVPEKIGLYLYETGYMAKSKFNMLSDIAERAQQIREDKD